MELDKRQDSAEPGLLADSDNLHEVAALARPERIEERYWSAALLVIDFQDSLAFCFADMLAIIHRGERGA